MGGGGGGGGVGGVGGVKREREKVVSLTGILKS